MPKIKEKSYDLVDIYMTISYLAHVRRAKTATMRRLSEIMVRSDP